MIVLFHSLTKTILLIFHDIGMKDKRCFRWEEPMKNYFQHLLNLKYHDNPSAPPPQKKNTSKSK